MSDNTGYTDDTHHHCDGHHSHHADHDHTPTDTAPSEYTPRDTPFTDTRIYETVIDEYDPGQSSTLRDAEDQLKHVLDDLPGRQYSKSRGGTLKDDLTVRYVHFRLSAPDTDDQSETPDNTYLREIDVVAIGAEGDETSGYGLIFSNPGGAFMDAENDIRNRDSVQQEDDFAKAIVDESPITRLEHDTHDTGG